MPSPVIETVAVVALTILGVSLLLLVVALLPLVSQSTRILATLDEIAKTIKTDILPNIAEMSGLLGKARKVVSRGQDFGNKIGESLLAVKDGLKSGWRTYKGSGEESSV